MGWVARVIFWPLPVWVFAGGVLFLYVLALWWTDTARRARTARDGRDHNRKYIVRTTVRGNPALNHPPHRSKPSAGP